MNDGDVRLCWITRLYEFGLVELLEHETGNRWLAVCVKPHWKPYDGSLVVVREIERRVYVLAGDNYGVLHDGDKGGSQAKGGRLVRVPEQRGSVGQGSHSQRGSDPGESRGCQSDDVAATRAIPVTAYTFALSSALGDATITTDVGGVIVSATGEYGLYYVGMKFREFMAGLKKADPTARYKQL